MQISRFVAKFRKSFHGGGDRFRWSAFGKEGFDDALLLCVSPPMSKIIYYYTKCSYANRIPSICWHWLPVLHFRVESEDWQRPFFTLPLRHIHTRCQFFTRDTRGQELFFTERAEGEKEASQSIIPWLETWSVILHIIALHCEQADSAVEILNKPLCWVCVQSF